MKDAHIYYVYIPLASVVIVFAVYFCAEWLINRWRSRRGVKERRT